MPLCAIDRCKHANRASPSAQLQTLMGMGFPEAEARAALDQFNGDEAAAVNSLLGGA